MHEQGAVVKKNITRLIYGWCHAPTRMLYVGMSAAIAFALPVQSYPILTNTGTAASQQLATSTNEPQKLGATAAPSDGISSDLCDYATTLIKWAEEDSADYQLGQSLEAAYCAEYGQDMAFYAEQSPMGSRVGSAVNAGAGEANASTGAGVVDMASDTPVIQGAPATANAAVMPRTLASGPQEQAFSGQANMMPDGQQTALDTALVLRQGASVSEAASQQPAQQDTQEPSQAQDQESSQDIDEATRAVESEPSTPATQPAPAIQPAPSAPATQPAPAAPATQPAPAAPATQPAAASPSLTVFNTFPDVNDDASRRNSQDEVDIDLIDPDTTTATINASAPPVFVMLLTLLLSSALLNRRAT